MRKIILCIAGLAIACSAAASPPDNRPPDNRPPPRPPPADMQQVQDQMQQQDQDMQQSQDVMQSQTSSSNNNVDIDDEKQAPGIGLSTAGESLGIGITTPVGGFLVNLPWSWGDRKLLPVCDRLVGTVNWAGCMCLTSTLKKLYDDPVKCATSLGGGSGKK